MGKIEGKIEGITEGIAKGRVEGRVENAKNMLKFGMKIEDIVTITGLPIDEIEGIGR